MPENKTPAESGINPVDSDTGQNDVYFSNEDFAKKIRDEKKANKNAAAAARKQTLKKTSVTTVASTYIFFIIVIAVSMLISVYAIFCLNDIFGITKNQSSVTVSYNEQITDPDKAIDILADNKLIVCRNFCKLFIKLETAVMTKAPVDGPYEPGLYYLNGKMGLENMLTAMKGSNDTSEVVRVTIPEGFTVPDIVDRLVNSEVCDRASLISVIESAEFTYSLVANLEEKETIPYRLEGFLFPDTYDFYVGMSASGAITKFLENTEAKIPEEYRKRAEELGFSMYEIMTIASIVQAEAGDNEQMPIIASVIENRLKDKTNYPSLGCQSTSDYINNEVAPSLSSTSAHTSEYYLNYYNTNSSSTVVGLPEGPICNPGIKAIEAALYPEETDYYFFFHDTKRNLYTASNYSEFRSKIQKYAPYLNY